MSSVSSGDAPIRVRRYSGNARIHHWINAISFVLLGVSGLSLWYPSLFFLAGLFGGGDVQSGARTVSWLHPWIGVVFAISFLGLFLRFFTANLPARGDGEWLGKLRHVLAGRDEYLPEVGKYNAGQKFVFWSMSILVPLMFLSGLAAWPSGLEWFQEQTGYRTTSYQRELAILVHSVSAVLMIVIWIVHVYAAIWVRGTISAMTRGSVTGGWGWRHHRKWLRKEVDRPDGKAPKQAAE